MGHITRSPAVAACYRAIRLASPPRAESRMASKICSRSRSGRHRDVHRPLGPVRQGTGWPPSRKVLRQMSTRRSRSHALRRVRGAVKRSAELLAVPPNERRQADTSTRFEDEKPITTGPFQTPRAGADMTINGKPLVKYEPRRRLAIDGMRSNARTSASPIDLFLNRGPISVDTLPLERQALAIL